MLIVARERLCSPAGAVGVGGESHVGDVGVAGVVFELTRVAASIGAISVEALIGDVGVLTVVGEALTMAGEALTVAGEVAAILP